MTEREEIMYEFLARISSTNAPIIFKGGLITKLILSENEYNDVQRSTVDIDASWMDSPPTMEEMRQTINNALGDFQENFYVDIMREYGIRNGVQRSAGFYIYKKIRMKNYLQWILISDPLLDIKLIFGENQPLEEFWLMKY